MNFNQIFKTYKGLEKDIYILFIGRVVNSIGAFVHPLMALILTQKIGMSVGEAGAFVTLLAAFQAPCMIVGGKLADTIGRKKVIIIFQLMGAVTLIFCGFLKPSILMTRLMILSSCFYSLSSPAFEALNADITNINNRKASYSLLYMGTNIGFCIGPILGGFLYKNYLSAIFIGDGITTLIALLLIIIFIKENKLENNNNQKIKQYENKLENNMEGSVFKVLLKRPELLLFSMGILMYHFAYSQWGFALPIQLENIFLESGAKLYGILGGLNGIIVIVLTPVLTSLTKKVDIVKTIAIGGGFYTIAFGMFGFSKKYIAFLIGILIMTIGEILITINQGTFIANNTPTSHRGRVSSILPLISGFGFAVGPMIMGDIIEKYNILTGWTIVAIISFVGIITMLFLEKFIKRKIN